MSLLTKLPQWFETKPLVLLRFEDGYESALYQTRHGLNRFTEVKSHHALSDLKPPTLCLAEMPDGKTSKFYVGVVKAKAAVATFDSRVTIIKLKLLNLSSFSILAENLDEKIFQTLLKQRLGHVGFASVLSPKLSVAVIDALVKDSANKSAIEAAISHIPKFRKISVAAWEQFNAIKTAMATFGLSAADLPETLEVADGSDSTLNYLDTRFDSVEQPPEEASVLEDNVIAADASVVPGFELKKKYVTGRAVFFSQGERLEIYTANKGPLEIMLGVDLIYINEVAGNTVMVQYKMLSTHIDPATAKMDSIFRPDEQFREEVERMKLQPVKDKPDDYRLHRSPFYFKFVKRKGDGDKHASFVVSLEHLSQYLESSKSKGPKGGVRISFDSLGGVYLRETDLLGLIRSGYVGTHRIQTNALKPIIEAVSEGKRALVLAWQKQIEREKDK
ncbi:MAG TPA: hypothetical protein VNN22_19485 [Verrucomicrobiae bacterium]|nr:hypothetical protein [Verrucomicrobiae bacterium]